MILCLYSVLYELETPMNEPPPVYEDNEDEAYIKIINTNYPTACTRRIIDTHFFLVSDDMAQIKRTQADLHP